MAGIASVGSALFTSTATVTANTFTTGTVVISTSPTSALVTFSNMAPGDRVANTLTISNTGSLDLRYAMTSAVTDTLGSGLKSVLTLGVKENVSSCTVGGYGLSGTEIYTGTLASALFGSPSPGAQEL
jgi:hypothetical protein